MPDWKPALRERLSNLSIAHAREADIVEELSQHLEDRWREHVASGVTPEDAEGLVRVELASGRLLTRLGALRQTHWRGMPPPGPSRAFSFDSVVIDLRQAIRSL